MTTNTTAEQDWSNWFDEDALNSKPIDWAYWVGKMPSLTAAQAACLMCLLDPAQYKNLDTNDEVEQAAHKIQRLAEAREYGPASPREWLDWADANTIKVHPGFRDEVVRSPPVATPTPHHMPPEIKSAMPGPTMSRQTTREERIIELLKSKSYDPLKLPKRERGKSGVKAEIRLLALGEPAQFTKSTFKSAWERLRSDNRVVGGK